ncbi:MAG: phosphatase PAP2-related protein [Myxococcaceae bacterium]
MPFDLSLTAPAPRAMLWVSARKLVAAFSFRFGCVVVMTWLILLAEARPAPTLPDALLSRVPYVGWVDRSNYLLWLGAYVPLALLLLYRDLNRFCRYMVSAGWIALLRGLCILATGLGPVHGADVNAGMGAARRWQALFEILSPIDFFGRGAARTYLTKDLFFSGHVSTTFLLLLYLWPFPRLRWAMLTTHLLVVASVFFSHLHYTIDVIGAYAITFSLFAVRELPLRRLMAGENLGSTD